MYAHPLPKAPEVIKNKTKEIFKTPFVVLELKTFVWPDGFEVGDEPPYAGSELMVLFYPFFSIYRIVTRLARDDSQLGNALSVSADHTWEFTVCHS
jgi:hypothetical protein